MAQITDPQPPFLTHLPDAIARVRGVADRLHRETQSALPSTAADAK